MKKEPKDELKPVEVFAGTAWQAGLLKSMLEDNEIEAFFGDEIIGTYAPWNAAPGGAGAVRVFVAQLEYDSAKIVVDQYYENLDESFGEERD
jgi:hypothetical protein